MTWDEIQEVVKELQKCNQNTPSQKVKDLVNKILKAKGCEKVYFLNGYITKELTVPVKSHGLELAAMLIGNSLTHECLPLWFRNGYAFQPYDKVIDFLKKKRNCE